MSYRGKCLYCVKPYEKLRFSMSVPHHTLKTEHRTNLLQVISLKSSFRITLDLLSILTSSLRFLSLPIVSSLPFFSASLSNLWLSPRPISKCQLSTLLHLHLIPIYLVVFKGSYCLGYLILRGASRLDAFSVYPCRTWLLCHRPDT